MSFAFKQKRFRFHHRAALRFPDSRFAFVGVDPPIGGKFDHKKAEKGVRVSGGDNTLFGSYFVMIFSASLVSRVVISNLIFSSFYIRNLMKLLNFLNPIRTAATQKNFKKNTQSAILSCDLYLTPFPALKSLPSWSTARVPFIQIRYHGTPIDT